MIQLTRKKWFLTNATLLTVLLISIVIAIAVGPEKISWTEAFYGNDLRSKAIILVSRLPRVLLAAVVGLALSSAGGAYQALLRNPLADPFILGVAGGAALASVIGLGVGAPFAAVSIIAFLGAAVAMVLIFSVSKTHGRVPVHTLLLTGVVFNAFCFALILFINATVNMEQAYQILFMLIGNLEVVDLGTVAITALFVLPGFFILCLISSRMNLLSLGDEGAMSLGVDVERLRKIIFFASSLMVGAAVAVAGLIGFVGLFIPHAVRLVFGADHRLLIPASGLVGAAFLVFADMAARTMLMSVDIPTQLPVGVLTALIGAPAFMWLLRRQLKEAA